MKKFDNRTYHKTVSCVERYFTWDSKHATDRYVAFWSKRNDVRFHVQIMRPNKFFFAIYVTSIDSYGRKIAECKHYCKNFAQIRLAMSEVKLLG